MFTLEEKLAAVELVRGGMSYRQASRACGASYHSIWKWHRALDDGVRGLYALVDHRRRPKEMDPVDLDDLPDDPEELKRIIRDQQFEIDITKAVMEIVKKDPGVDPRSLPNKDKAALVDALARTRPRYSISFLASSLHLAPATFYYHRKRIGADREAGLRARVAKACAERPMWGYRRIKHVLDEGSGRARGISEKRIRRIMREEGLGVARRRKHSRYSSYDARLDTGEALPNVPLMPDGTHDFSAPVPNSLWLTDVTELRLPAGERVYLSAVLDCYDSSLPGWEISLSPKSADLTDPSLKKAAARLGAQDRCTAHTDKGGHYFAESWKAICEEHGIERSMSRKGHSPDNARMEGFFGRMKMEFFDAHDWEGVSAERFMEELDAWLVYYNERRPKPSLGWIPPMQYRRRFYAAA